MWTRGRIERIESWWSGAKQNREKEAQEIDVVEDDLGCFLQPVSNSLSLFLESLML